MRNKMIEKIPKLSFKFLFLYFAFLFSILSFFSSGTIESEDGWLYLNVARNIYYKGEASAPPNEYAERKNVNMNSIPQDDGSWKAPGGLGYSISMLPAVALSDLYHEYADIPVPEHFPLESDWSLMFFASFTNLFFLAVIGVVMFVYLLTLGFKKKLSILISLLTVFGTNLLPLATFSFPHMIFIAFSLLSFLMVKWFVMSSKIKHAVFALLSFGLVAISYNVSFVLIFFGLAVYYMALSGKYADRKIWAVFGVGFGMMLLLVPKILGALSYNSVQPKILIEGLWGFLFSPGKSIFLYTPLFAIPVIYWHKIKKLNPEIIATLVLSAGYLFFYGRAYLDVRGRGQFPMWHGGASWGPRYVAILIPFLMIIVAYILAELKKDIRKNLLRILVPISFAVQIVGVLVPYQVQYRGLPYNIFVNGQEIVNYEYASFIPRYSPLFESAKDLARKISTYKNTRDHGNNSVYLYDGFDYPTLLNEIVVRSFPEQGHIAWKDESQLSKVMIELSNGIGGSYASASANVVLVVDGEEVSKVKMGPSERRQFTMTTEESDISTVDIFVEREKGYESEKMLLTGMIINDEAVNLLAVDYPYADYGTNSKSEVLERKYYGEVESDLWKLWYMRARVYEESLNLWWIRSFYYWDLPHKFLYGVIGFAGFSLITSGILFKKYLKRFLGGKKV